MGQIVEKYNKVKEIHNKERAKNALPGPGHKFYGEGVLREVERGLKLKFDHEMAKIEYQKKQKEADEWYERVKEEKERHIKEAYEDKARSDRIKAYLHRYLVKNLKKTV